MSQWVEVVQSISPMALGYNASAANTVLSINGGTAAGSALTLSLQTGDGAKTYTTKLSQFANPALDKITAANIATYIDSDAITKTQIASDTITNTKLHFDAGSPATNHVVTIGQDGFASGLLDTVNIEDGAVTDDKIDAVALTKVTGHGDLAALDKVTHATISAVGDDGTPSEDLVLLWDYNAGTDATRLKWVTKASAGMENTDTDVSWQNLRDRLGDIADNIVLGQAGYATSIPGAVTVGTDLTVNGDFTVKGSVTALETTNTAITDKAIELNVLSGGALFGPATAGDTSAYGTGNAALIFGINWYSESVGKIVHVGGEDITTRFMFTDAYGDATGVATPADVDSAKPGRLVPVDVKLVALEKHVTSFPTVEEGALCYKDGKLYIGMAD